MALTGQIGTSNSLPGNIVPGYGSGGQKFKKSLSATLNLTGTTPTMAHTYVFSIVSIALIRAISRPFNLITKPRLQL